MASISFLAGAGARFLDFSYTEEKLYGTSGQITRWKESAGLRDPCVTPDGVL